MGDRETRVIADHDVTRPIMRSIKIKLARCNMMRGPIVKKPIGCYVMCGHEFVVAKGRVVATMEKAEKLMSIGHLDETIERESIV